MADNPTTSGESPQSGDGEYVSVPVNVIVHYLQTLLEHQQAEQFVRDAGNALVIVPKRLMDVAKDHGGQVIRTARAQRGVALNPCPGYNC